MKVLLIPSNIEVFSTIFTLIVKKNKVKYIILSILITFVASSFSYAQSPNVDPQDTIPVSLFEKRYNEKYERNIKKSRINGVYIPKDLDQAYQELLALSSNESIDKFKNAEKEFVVSRLHYGLGRWMILNWNFYDGSRYSHYLTELGLSHPDDMARFTLLTFHDYVNGVESDINGTVEKLVSERKERFEADRKN